MELNKFISDFTNQFDDTDEGEVTATTIFKELAEWNSLNAMSLIAMTKTLYNKTITGNEIRSCKTVEDLFNLIAAK